MFELLRVPSEKLKGTVIRDVKDRITSLRLLLGRPVPFAEAEEALAEGFRQALSLEFIPSASPEEAADIPTGDEEERARELAAKKFSFPQWIFKR
jgi:lipoate-protein ligase A